jgi:hypothetical protein
VNRNWLKEHEPPEVYSLRERARDYAQCFLLNEKVWKYSGNFNINQTYCVAFFPFDYSSGTFFKVDNLNVIPFLRWYLSLVVEHAILAERRAHHKRYRCTPGKGSQRHEDTWRSEAIGRGTNKGNENHSESTSTFVLTEGCDSMVHKRLKVQASGLRSDAE